MFRSDGWFSMYRVFVSLLIIFIGLGLGASSFAAGKGKAQKKTCGSYKVDAAGCIADTSCAWCDTPVLWKRKVLRDITKNCWATKTIQKEKLQCRDRDGRVSGWQESPGKSTLTVAVIPNKPSDCAKKSDINSCVAGDQCRWCSRAVAPKGKTGSAKKCWPAAETQSLTCTGPDGWCDVAAYYEDAVIIPRNTCRFYLEAHHPARPRDGFKQGVQYAAIRCYGRSISAHVVACSAEERLLAEALVEAEKYFTPNLNSAYELASEKTVGQGDLLDVEFVERRDLTLRDVAALRYVRIGLRNINKVKRSTAAETQRFDVVTWVNPEKEFEHLKAFLGKAPPVLSSTEFCDNVPPPPTSPQRPWEVNSKISEYETLIPKPGTGDSVLYPKRPKRPWIANIGLFKGPTNKLGKGTGKLGAWKTRDVGVQFIGGDDITVTSPTPDSLPQNESSKMLIWWSEQGKIKGAGLVRRDKPGTKDCLIEPKHIPPKGRTLCFALQKLKAKAYKKAVLGEAQMDLARPMGIDWTQLEPSTSVLRVVFDDPEEVRLTPEGSVQVRLYELIQHFLANDELELLRSHNSNIKNRQKEWAVAKANFESQLGGTPVEYKLQSRVSPVYDLDACVFRSAWGTFGTLDRAR